MMNDDRIAGNIQENVMGLARVFQGVVWDFHDPLLFLVFATLLCDSGTKPKQGKENKNNLVICSKWRPDFSIF